MHFVHTWIANRITFIERASQRLRKDYTKEYRDRDLEGAMDERKRALTIEIPREITGFLSRENAIYEFQRNNQLTGAEEQEKRGGEREELIDLFGDARMFN